MVSSEDAEQDNKRNTQAEIIIESQSFALSGEPRAATPQAASATEIARRRVHVYLDKTK
jgi:hypothetical protein